MSYTGSVCSFKNCRHNNFSRCQPMIQLFTYPVEDNDRCLQWVLNSGNDYLLQLPSNMLANRRVCSKHFTPQMILNRRLVHDAVPMSYDVTLTYEGEHNNISTIDLTSSKPEPRTTTPAVDSLEPPAGSPLTIAELLPANLLANARKEAASPPVILVEQLPAASPPLILLEDSPGVSPQENAVEELPPTITVEETLLAVPNKDPSVLDHSTQNKPFERRDEDAAHIIKKTNPSSKLLCRLCMKVGGKPMIPIFMCSRSRHLATKILSVTGIVITIGDGLPNHICHECNENILKWHIFKKICFTSDKTYKKQFSKKQHTAHVSTIDLSHNSPLDPDSWRSANEPCQIVIDSDKPVKVKIKSLEHNKLLDTSAHFVKTKSCDVQTPAEADSKSERTNEPSQVIIGSIKPVEVKRELVEDDPLFDTSTHFVDANVYKDQDSEQLPQDAGDETLPPAFVSVKIEPSGSEGSMWNPEVSLKYSGGSEDDILSTSQLPPAEYEVQFRDDIVCKAGETPLIDPLSLSAGDKTISSSPDTPQTPIPSQTLRKLLLSKTRTKSKSYLLAVKPVFASSEVPPTYVLAVNPPTSVKCGSKLPAHISDKISNLPVIKNVPPPLPTRADFDELYDLYRPRRAPTCTIQASTAPVNKVQECSKDPHKNTGRVFFKRTPRILKNPTVALNTLPDSSKESNIPTKRSGDPLEKDSSAKISKSSPSTS